MNRELSGRIDNLSIFKKGSEKCRISFCYFLGALATLSESFRRGDNPGMANQSAI
jgi:hypothetical protein